MILGESHHNILTQILKFEPPLMGFMRNKVLRGDSPLQNTAPIEFAEKFNSEMVTGGNSVDGVGALTSSSSQDQGQLVGVDVNKLPKSNTPIKNHQNGSNFFPSVSREISQPNTTRSNSNGELPIQQSLRFMET